MEKFNQNPKEYRKDLSKVLKDVKKIDPESAEFLRDKEKEKQHYQESEELVRYQHKLEKELNGFESGTFNVCKVKEKIDDKELEKIKKLGYNVEKEVFVSLNKGHSDEGFELLKAIDKELKKGKTKNLKIYVVNEFAWNEPSVNNLSIPFKDMPLEKKSKYEPTITDVLKDSKKDELEKYVLKEVGSYNGQTYIRTVNQFKENKCELIEEWAKFLSESFTKSGFSYHEYSTHDSHMGDTRSHSDPTTDPKQFRILFNEFLKQKNVELIETSKKLGDYEKAIPVATEAYNILLNTDGRKYGLSNDRWRENWEEEQKAGKKETYGEQIAIQLMARPKSIFDQNYTFGKERLKKINKRY